jgi:NAD(P)-dependent dehydrogenase (short-subunit alcohol dehydrogenase family)
MCRIAPRFARSHFYFGCGLRRQSGVEFTGAPMGDPVVVAGVIAMLVSDDGAFITGTEIRVGGGTHT